jgi:hypothetical protein
MNTKSTRRFVELFAFIYVSPLAQTAAAPPPPPTAASIVCWIEEVRKIILRTLGDRGAVSAVRCATELRVLHRAEV